MNYSELRTAIIGFAHRPDLIGQVPTFIQLAEGMIRRDLVAMPQSLTLTDSDRVAPGSGLYTMPDTVQIRTVFAKDARQPLTQVGIHQIRELPGNAPVLRYAVSGSTVEFRGIPGESAEIEVQYHGHPAPLVTDEDTNDLLEKHQALYLFGSLFQLYQFTHDMEMAQGPLDVYQATIDQLNAANSRNLGGASPIAGYEFGPPLGGY